MTAGLRSRIDAAHRGATAPLLLDGAVGTELERRGLDAGLPLWSARALLEAPGVVREVHLEHARAGAEVLTANTFRTQARTLERAGVPGRAAELTARAVGLAREAAAAVRPEPFVVGSAAPLEDCYHPERVPGADELAREHADHARNLARAGVDAILAETLGTVREAVAAAAAAREAGVGALVSFVCDGRGRLLSGEPLAEAVAALRDQGVWCVGVNCLPPSALEASLRALVASGGPFSAHPNLGAPTAEGWREEACAPADFPARVAPALRAGVALVGGCCGTHAAHVAALRSFLGPPGSAPKPGEGRSGRKMRHSDA